jgi:hypothetical protein
MIYRVWWLAGPEAPALGPVVGVYASKAEADDYMALCREHGETVECRPVPGEMTPAVYGDRPQYAGVPAGVDLTPPWE